MKTFLKDAKFILIFFLFLTIFTVFSNFELGADQAEAKSLESINNEIGAAKTNRLRVPASIDEHALLILNKEFFCNPLGKSVQHKVVKPIVLINFRMCQEPKSVLSLSLENQSNGYKAQIFKMDLRNFKTDYIQLNEGLNRLKLVVILKNGQKIEESLEILSGF